jgi:hypothetical protein
MGYVAVGAAAIVAAEVAGMFVEGILVSGGTVTPLVAVVGDIIGTEFADGGVAAAVSDCGVPTVEGSTGADGSAGVAPSALRAIREESATAASFFHQASFWGICAQRGPDWQPAMASAKSATHDTRIELVFMANVSPESFARNCGARRNDGFASLSDRVLVSIVRQMGAATFTDSLPADQRRKFDKSATRCYRRVQTEKTRRDCRRFGELVNGNPGLSRWQ